MTTPQPPSITSKDRAHLRSLAHDLNPLVQIGMGGVTEGVRDAVDVVLTEHELIKVRFGQNFDGDRKAAGAELAAALGADLTQSIGRIAVLYRPRGEDIPDKPRIKLPSGG
ncbi:MAG: YhbY family RNA-binding protein [Myxococcota bacterium]